MIKDRDLARSKRLVRRGPGRSAFTADQLQMQAARRHKGAPRSYKPNNFDQQLRRCAGSWDVTARTARECFDYRLRIIGGGQYNDRSNFQKFSCRKKSCIITIASAFMCVVEDEVQDA